MDLNFDGYDKGTVTLEGRNVRFELREPITLTDDSIFNQLPYLDERAILMQAKNAPRLRDAIPKQYLERTEFDFLENVLRQKNTSFPDLSLTKKSPSYAHTVNVGVINDELIAQCYIMGLVEDQKSKRGQVEVKTIYVTTIYSPVKEVRREKVDALDAEGYYQCCPRGYRNEYYYEWCSGDAKKKRCIIFPLEGHYTPQVIQKYERANPFEKVAEDIFLFKDVLIPTFDRLGALKYVLGQLIFRGCDMPSEEIYLDSLPVSVEYHQLYNHPHEPRETGYGLVLLSYKPIGDLNPEILNTFSQFCEAIAAQQNEIMEVVEEIDGLSSVFGLKIEPWLDNIIAAGPLGVKKGRRKKFEEHMRIAGERLKDIEIQETGLGRLLIEEYALLQES